MKTSEAQTDEFKQFDSMMSRLIRVPHSEIKAKLDAEKAAKKRKPKRASASRDSSDREGA
jgi:hypothetical protein